MSGSVSSLNTWRSGVGWGDVNKEKIICSSMWNAGSGDIWIWICMPIFRKKSMSTPKRLLWKERKEKPVNVPPGSASKTHTKREFCQILARKFGTIRLAKCLFRFGEKKKIIFRKRCFYEHSFRSAGMFIFSCGWLYGHLPVALAPVGSVRSVKCHKKRPLLLPSWPQNGWSTLLWKVNFGSVGYSWNQPEWVAWDSIIFDRARHCAKCADCTEWFF